MNARSATNGGGSRTAKLDPPKPRGSVDNSKPGALPARSLKPVECGEHHKKNSAEKNTALSKVAAAARTRDNLVFRRQERAPYSVRTKGNATPENSPARGATTKDATPKTRTEDAACGGDDARLIRLIQRLEREEDRERRVTIVRQLKEYVLSPDGAKLLPRNLSSVTCSIGTVLTQRMSGELKSELIQCLASLGFSLGSDAKGFFEWMFAIYNSTITDDARIVLLRSLLEALQQDKDGTQLSEVMPVIMSAIKSALEIADQPELLTSIVDVIVHISSVCPSLFAEHFRDTVDILVGWHIDASQAPSLTRYTSAALISFRRYWLADISFSVTLLGQFLEDMDAYAEELIQGGSSESEGERHSASECMAKISSLIRVFTTVLKSLGDHGSPSKCSAITWDFLTESLKTLLSCMIAPDVMNQTSLLLAANECMCLLLHLLQSNCVTSLDSLVSYVASVLPRVAETRCEEVVVSTLDVIASIIKEVNTQLPLDFVAVVLGSPTTFRELRFFPSTQVQQRFFAVHHAVLALKNVPLLEEAYRCLLFDLETSYSTLVGRDVSLTSSDGKKSAALPAYTLQQAQVALLSTVCSLAEIANTKHSIIGMWALKPNFFDLVTCHLDLISEDISAKYPALQYSLLYILYSHCKRHGNFISSSTLVVQQPVSSSTPALVGSTMPVGAVLPSVVAPPSSKHFSRILRLQTVILRSKKLLQDSRMLCIHWSHEIVEGMQQHISQLADTDEVKDFVHALAELAFCTDLKICVCACRVLNALLKSGAALLPTTFLKMCYEACVLNVTNNNATVKEAYWSLFRSLPLDSSLSHYPPRVAKLGSHRWSSWSPSFDGCLCSPEDLWEARRDVMIRSPSAAAFHVHDFRTIMAFLLQGKQPKNDSWLWRMFFSCQYLSGGLSVPAYPPLLWHWATWEAAQLCVTTRLRTPVGKPQETFTAIEATIKSFARDTPSQDKMQSKGAPNNQLLQVRLLLDFTEHLEQLMYNAYEGCAVALPTPPKAVRTFFRTNRATCQEWLSRIRMAVMMVAIRCGDAAATIRHGYELLREMTESGNVQANPEFDHVLVYVVQALISLRCPEAVLGLYVWCKEKLGVKKPWIKAAVDQAAGRFENGIQEYLFIMRSDVANENEDSAFPLTTKDNPFIESFLMHQIVECYRNLGCWGEAFKWNEYRRGTARDILCFDEYDASFVRMLSFPDKDCTGSWESASSLGWDATHQLLKAEGLLVSCGTRAGKMDDDGNLVSDLSKVTDVVRNLMETSCLAWPPHIEPMHCALYMAAGAAQQKASKMKVSPIFLTKLAKVDPPDDCCSTYVRLLAWNDQWFESGSASFRSSRGQSFQQDLLLVGAHLARKQQNMCLAQNLLVRYSQSILGPKAAVTTLVELDSDPVRLRDVLRKVRSRPPSDATVRIQREGAKLLYSWGCNEGAVDTLLECVSCLDEAIPQAGRKNAADLDELHVRSLLSLVKYLQQDAKHLEHLLDDGQHRDGDIAVSRVALKKILDASASAQLVGGCPSLQADGVVSETESVVGQLLCMSVYRCSSLAKAWSALAAWNYRWGRKAVDVSSNGTVELLPEEKSEALSLLPKDVSPEEQEAVLSFLGQIHDASEEPDVPMDLLSGSSPRVDVFQKQLLSSCPSLQSLPDCKLRVDGLFHVWHNVMHRVYAYYRSAAKAYFSYLQLAGQYTEEKHEDGNVTATLRLLRLVVKHASELRDVLEEGLARTPTGPWRGIIPQLFSRLSHPEPYVRQSISDLLCRVAQASPHLIVFPAVVGSLTLNSATDLEHEPARGLLGACLSQERKGKTDKQKGDSDHGEEDAEDDEQEEDEDDKEEDEEEERKAAIMQNCFAALVETLGHQNARIIAEVKTLVHELRRITLLWDELWSGTLSLHLPELARRMSTLEDEVKKVYTNPSLSKEEKTAIIRHKHNIFVKPTIFVLEQLLSITSQPAETPHEHWFQNTFSQQIREVVLGLADPPDPSQPQLTLNLYKQLHQSIQQRVQHQARSHLSIDQISPVLASLHSTVIPMPGLGTAPSPLSPVSSFGSTTVSVEMVHSHISILPTKTKPKKLAFLGSDGKKYTYLFKGLEDLHLDERIMQFLSIVNNMFAKTKRYGRVMYYARHYSVTPLGPRSGLIQWVDGATPLFGLYKRWQQREALAQAIRSNSQASFGPPAILRPSEIYYNKLTPLLKEKGITNLENRREWPLSILLQVLKELMEETPADLLAKELWCSCSSTLNYWEVTQTYCRSTAVMSMIGYVIGLGDRHLDNVLVDLHTGEVVHIDYNVCFEKGKNLRVPEKVPFRMTPNIETALGVSGIEGTFRASCEHVLKVLRRGRETLLTLLEAFVYDPLVDWTPGNEGGYTGAVYGGGQASIADARKGKQLMEREIVRSMLAVRVAEMKVEWTENRNELCAALSRLESALHSFAGVQGDLHSAENSLQEACQQRALLEEALNDPNHAFYNLPSRFKEFARVKATLASAKEAVREKLLECKKWHNLHKMALKALSGSELAKWCAEVSCELHTDDLSVTPVVDFLQSAGQGQLIQQCEHAESELGAILQQHRLALRNCVDLLTTYATIVLQFPHSYHEHSRSFQWLQWLESLLSDFTLKKCQDVISDFHGKYGAESLDMTAVQAAISIKYHLQSVIADINAKLLGVLERRRLEAVEDSSGLACAVADAKGRIRRFVKENGSEGSYSLCCVAMTVACALNKRLLMMEGAAASAGDCLVDLTSWGGDWFLDDIFSTYANLKQLLDLLMDNVPSNLDSLKLAHGAISSVGTAFAALQDLSTNFQSIILPEAVKNIQSEESTVLEMVDALDTIINDCGVPLEELVAQLEVHLRNIIMEIHIPPGNVTKTVRSLEAKFDKLLSGSHPHISDLSPGQMLMMGFNGLFTKLESDTNDMLAQLDAWAPPTTWRKIDVVREARGLVPVQLISTRGLLKSIFFIKRLQVMQQFFSLCRLSASTLSLKVVPPSKDSVLPVPTDEQFFRPVKAFIGEYFRKQLLGTSSHLTALYLCQVACSLHVNVSAEIELKDVGAEGKASLEDIGKKAVDACLKSQEFQPSHLAQAGTLVGNLDAAWRKDDLARRLEQHVMLLKASFQRAQLQLARHQWWHEDLLAQGNAVQNVARPARANVMSELRKTMQAMLSLESSLSVSQERYLNLNASIEQRLKWAAGANPALASVQEEFESAIAEKTAVVTSATQLSRELVNLTNAILNFEALRTRTSEALSSDGTFLALINRCQESCMLAENCRSQVSSLEEKLLTIKPMVENGRVNEEWIASLLEKVSQSLAMAKEKLDKKRGESTTKWEEVKEHTLTIRSLLSTHHHLMSEVRNILKSLAKHEEQEFGCEAKTSGVVHAFFVSYRAFSEQIASLVRDILSESDTSREGCGCSDRLLKETVPLVDVVRKVYEDLVVIAGPLLATSHPIDCMRTTVLADVGKQKKGDDTASLESDAANEEHPRNKKEISSKCAPDLLCDPSPASQGHTLHKAKGTGGSSSTVARDPRTGKAVQERNTYATNVWRRVKVKLDGRDPDITKRMTVVEQVDFVIREATNLENLAVLYEGWTPWV